MFRFSTASETLTHATISTGLACVSGGTDTHVCTDQVLAGHTSAGTVIYTVFTLVLVWGSKSIMSLTITVVKVRTCTCAHEELPPEMKHRSVRSTDPDTRKPVGESWGSVWSCNVNRDAADSE